jgi:hypothetical protein
MTELTGITTRDEYANLSPSYAGPLISQPDQIDRVLFEDFRAALAKLPRSSAKY